MFLNRSALDMAAKPDECRDLEALFQRKLDNFHFTCNQNEADEIREVVFLFDLQNLPNGLARLLVAFEDPIYMPRHQIHGPSDDNKLGVAWEIKFEKHLHPGETNLSLLVKDNICDGLTESGLANLVLLFSASFGPLKRSLCDTEEPWQLTFCVRQTLPTVHSIDPKQY